MMCYVCLLKWSAFSRKLTQETCRVYVWNVSKHLGEKLEYFRREGCFPPAPSFQVWYAAGVQYCSVAGPQAECPTFFRAECRDFFRAECPVFFRAECPVTCKVYKYRGVFGYIFNCVYCFICNPLLSVISLRHKYVLQTSYTFFSSRDRSYNIHNGRCGDHYPYTGAVYDRDINP